MMEDTKKTIEEILQEYHDKNYKKPPIIEKCFDDLKYFFKDRIEYILEFKIKKMIHQSDYKFNINFTIDYNSNNLYDDIGCANFSSEFNSLACISALSLESIYKILFEEYVFPDYSDRLSFNSLIVEPQIREEEENKHFFKKKQAKKEPLIIGHKIKFTVTFNPK